MWDALASYLPHLNAALNITATVLLAMGLWNIKNGRAKQHKKLMVNAFLVSIAFLGCYLFHKLALFQSTGQWNKPFPTDAPQAARITYFSILIPHILLAIAVPVLAMRAIYLAKNGRIVAHKKWVRFAFPVWMYVSVTGVLVYLMLYQLYA
ncbi:DUF420 domain-containing protein [Rhodopirellula sallentina]|uniref:Membrane protein containing DUF420 n=1 Tax=Rhodopirellula sallentina SM41 TaxID=1263870 RepID=M5TYR9_9BACT|nr:DUF420 domain-containing protein [Rhodopirellula sallentina]EMI54362.1 membrane protein containing DUF420 [Rhodopirellula sallentina SM41]